MKKLLNHHHLYMQRCLTLAQKGLGNTYPNPLVGCVIVCDNEIIGEGWHHKAGQAHAEVNAIASVKDKQRLKRSTLYVSLEPCSHHGQTPPCTDLIIQHRIPNVVVGCIDPFEKVNGGGIAALEKAGINVSIGPMKKEAIALNKRFFTFHQQKRPYIILKWAQSQDGFIAPLANQRHEKAPVFLSSKEDRRLVHQWRSQEQAILVGAQTVEDDNPQLTTREIDGPHPVRVVLDPNQRLSQNYAVFNSDAKTLHLTKKVLALKGQAHPKEVIEKTLAYLYRENISSLIVEGGSRTLAHFIAFEFWDEARVFTPPIELTKGVPAPPFSLENIKGEKKPYQLIFRRQKEL
ncbi:MAG: bifunctional diaminohydroxyphosphoribosylaminopyrimidine deaminase/5-amino-6-(5-phosphoribosylamino)uracil reductase RibD [Flavobacteriaceae bacterium]